MCSARLLAGLPAAVRERAVRVRASVLKGGKYRRLEEPGLSQVTAQRTYRIAGLQPQNNGVAEVHDDTSFCEVYQAEMLGFCAVGAGGTYVASGATALCKERHINVLAGRSSRATPSAPRGYR